MMGFVWYTQSEREKKDIYEVFCPLGYTSITIR
jgi:hypothetical protein